MIYCTECGTPNAEGSQVCVKCKTKLPVLGYKASVSVPHNEPTPEARLSQPSYAQPAPSVSWWQRLGPDWKAALVFYVVWWVLNTLSTVTGGAAFIFSFPFQVIASLLQGVYVAKLAAQDRRYTQADYLRLGIFSGAWSGLLDLGTQVIIFAVMLGVTLGGALALLPMIALKFFGSSVTNLVLVGLGAEVYRRQNGKDLTRPLIIVGCLSSTLICVLIAIVVAILSAVGISIFQQFG